MPEPKLTQEQVEIWVDRIKRSFRSRKYIETIWRKLDQYYAGNYYQFEEDRDRVAASWHLVAERQTVASIADRNPTMYFTGRTEKGNVLAPLMEGVTHYERKLIGQTEQERKALHHAYRYGTGVLKHSWNTQYGPGDAWASGLKVPKNLSPGSNADTALEDSKMPLSIWTEHEQEVFQGHVWTKAINPRDILVDSEALIPAEARWWIHLFRRPWVDVVRDTRYEKEAREKVQPSGLSSFFSGEIGVSDGYGDTRSRGGTYGSSLTEDRFARDASMVELAEVYDVSTNNVTVLADQGGGQAMALRHKPYPFPMLGSPYTVLQFYPVEDSFWALPPADTYTPQVEAMNKLRTQFMDHIQRHGAMRGAYNAMSGLDDKAVKDFLSATDSFLKLKTNEDISKVFYVLPYTPIAADAWRLAEVFFNDYQLVSGLSELALGGSKGVSTATEATILNNQQQIRHSDLAGDFDAFIRESTRKTVTLLKQNWGAERVVPIVGPDGQVWRQATLTHQNVNEAYDVDIEPGSTQKEDKNVRVRQIIDSIERYKSVDPLLQAQGFGVDWVELIKEFTAQIGLFRNPDKIIKALPALQPQQPQNVTQFPGQAPLERPGTINNLGQAPAQGLAAESGRALSEGAAV
jgi:hypothetical protein